MVWCGFVEEAASSSVGGVGRRSDKEAAEMRGKWPISVQKGPHSFVTVTSASASGQTWEPRSNSLRGGGRVATESIPATAAPNLAYAVNSGHGYAQHLCGKNARASAHVTSRAERNEFLVLCPFGVCAVPIHLPVPGSLC